MDLSVISLIVGGLIVILALVFCFFGYKLARLLLPLCGLIVLEGILYIFIYNMLDLNELGTWLFFGGSTVALYIILFFIKRIAGFFVGLLGSALILIYIVTAFGLQTLDYVYPVCFTLCVISGLLAVVYERVAVIVFTSLFGACVAAYAGICIIINGLGLASFIAADMASSLLSFLSANTYLIAGISVIVALLGIFIQFSFTSHKRVLPGDVDTRSFKMERTRRYTPKDGIYS